jgi:DNA-binding transcriptional LysR family regulator
MNATPPSLTHRQLALFRSVMLQGNLSRAAEANSSSQPTLSRELARLEQLLGYPLFDRVRGRLRPTVRAQALMLEVERSFVGLEQVAQRALELRTHSSTRLQLACLPALAHALVPQALARLCVRHPDAQVSVVPLESPWLEQAVSEQRFDLALSETTEPPTGTTRAALLQANEVAVLPAGHALCRRTRLLPADFAGLPFVSLAMGDPYRQAIDTLFLQNGVQREMRMEAASAVAVCAMVAQGLGVAIVNPLTAAAMEGAALQVRPISADIPFTVSALVPQVLPEHPLRAPLLVALEKSVKTLSLS